MQGTDRRSQGSGKLEIIMKGSQPQNWLHLGGKSWAGRRGLVDRALDSGDRGRGFNARPLRSG